MNDTAERVCALMAKELQLDPSLLRPEVKLQDLGVDSLSALEFVFALEKEFRITFDRDVDLRGGEVQHVIDVVDVERSRMAHATAG